MDKAQYSNTKIRNIGKEIRKREYNLTDENLEDLEKYRISYKNDIAAVYNLLYDLSHNIYKNSIATYRIKRIESIIGKLIRFPSMKLDRMWDIAGCRCILNSNKQLYQLRDSINNNFEVIKVNDYIAKPQPDGYKSLHIYVRCKKNRINVIEIQLRNKENHNWATLVEITDLLFDERLKEKRSNSNLRELHLLFSNRDGLNIKEKERIIKLIRKYYFLEKLSEVFSRNYLSIRKQWIDLEKSTDNTFILIEASKDIIPKIDVYNSFDEAEKEYFTRFDKKLDTNRVLTHFVRPTYKKISIAYSNYVLTYHQFMDDCFKLLESLILNTIRNKMYIKFRKYYFYYLYISAQHIINLRSEYKEFISNSDKETKANKEWYGDIIEQVKKREDKNKELIDKMNKELINNTFSVSILRLISNRAKKLYDKKIESGT